MDDDAYRTRPVGEDCSDLLAVRATWFPAPDEEFAPRFREWWSRERHQRHAVVAYRGPSPVGMANGQVFSRMPSAGRPPAQWLYAANVFVPPEHRRRGVARALVQELVDYARSRSMVRVVLAPSPMSVPLYEYLGFRPAHDLMRLDLSGDSPR